MKVPKVLKRSLKKNYGKTAIVSTFILFSLAVAVIALSSQLNIVLSEIFNPIKNSTDFVVAGKKISFLSDAGNKRNNISDDEIKTILKVQGVKKISHVYANSFKAEASAVLGSSMYYTELFFESIPDSQLETIPPEWDTKEYLPILISKDFLALYNMGFAPSRSLPQLNAESLSLLSFVFELSGSKGSVSVLGKIVGTCDRFSSIIIPESRMKELNLNLTGTSGIVRRVLVQVSDAKNPNLVEVLNTLNMEISSSNNALSQVSYIAKIILTILFFIGIVFAFAACVIVVLGIENYLEKQKSTWKQFILLGYERLTLVKVLIPSVLSILIFSWFTGLACSSILYFLLADTLKSVLQNNSLFLSIESVLYSLIPLSMLFILSCTLLLTKSNKTV